MVVGQRQGRKRKRANVPGRARAGVEAQHPGQQDEAAGDGGENTGQPGPEQESEFADSGAGGEDLHIAAEALARILGLTEQRITQLVAEGMPRKGRGLYPMAGCVQWYIRYWQTRAQGRADPRRMASLDLKDDLIRAKLQKETGDFIGRKEVVQVWTATFLRLGKALDGLGPSLGREFSLSTDVIRGLRERTDEFRENFARDSAEYIEAPEVKKPVPKDGKSGKQ